MNQAQELLTRVEIESGKIGLHLNPKKSEIMNYNEVNQVPLLAKDCSAIKIVDDFKYLGA